MSTLNFQTLSPDSRRTKLDQSFWSLYAGMEQTVYTADDRPTSHRGSSTENIALSLTAFKEELEEIHWIKADVGNEDARLIQAPEAAVNIVQGLFLVCSHGKYTTTHLMF